MMLYFPNLDTLELVCAAGIVPAEIVSGPAQVSFAADGGIMVEIEGQLSKATLKELARYQVQPNEHHLGDIIPVLHWLQIVPTRRTGQPPQYGTQTPILFELHTKELLPEFVQEMLRLGNDRQSIRRIVTPQGDDKILLRVVGPPYYTLLRALDDEQPNGTPRVVGYQEVSPRVWVQVGFVHPHAELLNPPEGQLLLLRAGRVWQSLPEGPLQDLYEVLQFDIPRQELTWQAATLPGTINVPMKLVAGNAADTPELWVLPHDAIEQLDLLVRDSDERLIERLKFAIAKDTATDQSTIVLRVTTSKQAPPQLNFKNVVGYKPYYKLPNLFLPSGQRLHPTLRRDAVRRLLAENPDRLVWLAPLPNGSFLPHSISEDSFRPLSQWVEYILELEHEHLSEWLAVSRFEFESFQCQDSDADQPKPLSPDRGKKGKPLSTAAELKTSTANPNTSNEPAQPKTTEQANMSQLADVLNLVDRSQEAWAERRKELETEFLAIDAPLDAPERERLWVSLAEANEGVGDLREAALCQLYLLWCKPNQYLPLLSKILQAECPQRSGPVVAHELQQAFAPEQPTPSETRAAAWLWLLAITQQLPEARTLLSRAKRFFEAHESKLPLRLQWLVALQTADFAGADTLGLARTRDRILQRLLEEGIRTERDLPFFLRAGTSASSERERELRSKTLEIHRLVRAWAEVGLSSGPNKSAQNNQSDQLATLGYIDLMFAYAMAKFGEQTEARSLAEQGRKLLLAFNPTEDRGITAHFLARAFQARVDLALEGKAHRAGFDPALQKEFEQIQAKSKSLPGTQGNSNPFGIGYYAIGRMLEQSNLLEPLEKLDPYRDFKAVKDDFRRELAELEKFREPALLKRKILQFLERAEASPNKAEYRFVILMHALPLAGRVDETFTMDLLRLVPETMKPPANFTARGSLLDDKSSNRDLITRQAKLLEISLLLAANYDRTEVVQSLSDEFIELVQSKTIEDEKFRIVNAVAGRCLKSLRKLGRQEQIRDLLARMEQALFPKLSYKNLRENYIRQPDVWSKALQSLLYLAGGRLAYGLTSEAEPIIELAREELLTRKSNFQPKDFAPLVQAYIYAISQGSPSMGIPLLIELFEKIDPTRITNSFTTSKFYSRFHLNLVEEVVLGLVSDDFAWGSHGRRWQEEEEFLVRKRIHADLRKLLEQAKL